jgi:hypothetical protein
MRIDAIQIRSRGDEVELAALVHELPRGLPPFRLWFRFPRDLEPALGERADPFLPALLFVAVVGRSPLAIDGAVSERLASGAHKAMEIWQLWYSLPPVPVTVAELVAAANPAPRAVASFFSGGVDSFYTVLKNLGAATGEPKISELLFVWGLDIPLANATLHRTVSARLRAVAEALGLRLVLVSTNLRELTDRFAAWGKCHFGAGLSAIASCLGKHLRQIYLPASYTYSYPHPWGSHPLLDPLWSTETLTVIHDGCEATRPEKIRWQLGRSPLALSSLRVCFVNPDNAYNCGRCEKCLRTMVNLEAAGVLDQCSTFDAPLDLDRVRGLPLTTRQVRMAKDNLIHLDRFRGDPRLRAAVAAALARGVPLRRRALEQVEDLDLRYLGGRLRDLAKRRTAR